MKEQLEWAELGSFRSYVWGLVLSIALTIAAYFVVVKHVFTGLPLMLVVVGLSGAQMVAQFIFFLHLGKESKPRWNVMVFLFMLLIVAIIVLGSLWIMHNLDYNMMSSHEMPYEGM